MHKARSLRPVNSVLMCGPWHQRTQGVGDHTALSDVWGGYLGLRRLESEPCSYASFVKGPTVLVLRVKCRNTHKVSNPLSG